LLKPKLLITLKDYTKEKFISDLMAGLIVWVVALPMAIAFAIAGGVSPEKGIITAIIAGFLISALGGTRVQIGGPAGSFVVIMCIVLHKFGHQGLTIATIMAGVFLILMGLARFGSVIKFIPYPVIAGFTSGIAVFIFSSQVKDFLGLTIKEVPIEFIPKWIEYFKHFDTIDFYDLGIGIISLVIILVWQRYFKKIPGTLIAIIGTTILVKLFNLPVDTIGSRFGQIDANFSLITLPQVNFSLVAQLIGPAFTIAILASIEALMSAVVADGMIGTKHNSNMELIANGVANVVSPLFGGIPAAGAVARTATNIKNGARTPIAGIIQALILLLVMVFFGKLASLIPIPTLAAILMVVAYNMSEWRSFVSLLKSPRSDVIVLLLTFGLTVIFDVTIALEVGLLMSVFLFMRRMALVTNIEYITGDDDEQPNDVEIDIKIPECVDIYEINGPLFFGAAYKFEEAIGVIKHRPKVLIIQMRNVPAIDSTGIHTLKQIITKCQKQNIVVMIAGLQRQPRKTLIQTGIVKQVGRANISSNLDKLLLRAQTIVQNTNLQPKKTMIAS